jgi:hypothetical protein
MKSQYLERVPISKALKYRCYYCNRIMSEIPRRGMGAYQRTKDHVNLSSRNNSAFRDGAANNIRPCCFGCNQLRARLDHCCGALMMVLMEPNQNICPLPKRRPSRAQKAETHRMRKATVRQAMRYGV